MKSQMSLGYHKPLFFPHLNIQGKLKLFRLSWNFQKNYSIEIYMVSASCVCTWHVSHFQLRACRRVLGLREWQLTHVWPAFSSVIELREMVVDPLSSLLVGFTPLRAIA